MENELTLLAIKHIKDQNRDAFQRLLEELQPYDIALLYKSVSHKHHLKFLSLLSSEQIAMVVQELEQEDQIDIIHMLGMEKSSVVMENMESDELTDLMNGLSPAKIEEFLSLMKREESANLQRLMEYPPESAGGLMTDSYVWIRKDYTVREAVDKLKTFADLAASLYYLYVLDENKKLVGVVSYRDLLLEDLNERIENFMFTRVISVPTDMDQEQVADIIQKYDFVTVPVVDENERLVGIITVDDVIDVVIREANEDIEKLSATGKSIDFNTSAFTASLRRLPWLILLLFLGVVSGSIISGFEDTLQKVVALTFFMPMIAGMTGNTGTQSLAVVVRGLVSHDVDQKTVFKLILRELTVGIIIGSTCGMLIAAIAYVWQGSPILGWVVGSSLFITLIIGTLAGTVIPLILYRLKIDPAVASGPLITTLNDIFSLTVYFGTASLFISHLT